MDPPPSYPGLAETPSTSIPAPAPNPAPTLPPAKILIVRKTSPYLSIFVGLMILTSSLYWFSVRRQGV
ncbi:hypothetical protein CAEBREN_31886 [Caenorhabditis brenneri]|uniref:Uncharacterized protein n=1 Tax=Caenorhabditis brenneri TaxID=135651 RepID=G0NE13_CAEBE|nr:hypothetical protein CAEBREN_31886 [Caenorhabditis brenneri]